MQGVPLMSDHRFTNRLADETSPYLLQHAHNPVDWYPWGAEAFEKAKREDKPIFLSIGYSACHWCHVMEHESFENDAIAEFLNRHFVSIKVDREERPDVDDPTARSRLLLRRNVLPPLRSHGNAGIPSRSRSRFDDLPRATRRRQV